MKKLALSVVIATSFLFNVANADILKSNETIPVVHEVIVSKTQNIELVGKEKKEFVYMGKLNDYSEIYTQMLGNAANGAIKGLEVASSSAANTMGTGLQNGLQGAGLGLLVGVGVVVYDKVNADFKYLYVYDLTNSKNEKTRVSVMFISDKYDNEEVIKNYLMKY